MKIQRNTLDSSLDPYLKKTFCSTVFYFIKVDIAF